MRLAYSTELEYNTKTCPVCGVHYCLERRYDEYRRDKGEGWKCPNGHDLVYTETEVAKLRKQLERTERDRDFYKTNYQHEQKSHSATKGQITKLKKRAAAGVCSCCNRTFQNLARHMKTKHPEHGK